MIVNEKIHDRHFRSEVAKGNVERALEHVIHSALATETKKVLEKRLVLVAGLMKDTVEVRHSLFLAVGAMGWRFQGDETRERRLLVAAIAEDPRDALLYVRLARLEKGTGTALELFALENALRLLPRWREGRVRFVKAVLEATRPRPKEREPRKRGDRAA